MKRKLVKQGATTMMISLPAKWIQEQNLDKGDEVDVSEENNSIIIKAKGKEQISRLDIDVTNWDLLARRLIGCKFVEGADDISITSKNPEILKDIATDVKGEMIGFEIIEQSKEKLKIKQVSHIDEEEFDTMLRRTFLLVKMMALDVYDALKEGEKNKEHIIQEEENVNRFAKFCLRTINKKIRKSPPENCGLYMIVSLLENLGDSLKKIASESRGKPSKEMLEAIKLVIDLYSDYVELFYKFNHSNATAFAAKYKIVDSMLKKLRIKDSEQALFLANLKQSLNYIVLMLENKMIYYKA